MHVSTDQTNEQWTERKTDQDVSWSVIKLIGCRLNWLTPSGEWTRRLKYAAAWGDRQQAYGEARAYGGLLHMIERSRRIDGRER